MRLLSSVSSSFAFYSNSAAKLHIFFESANFFPTFFLNRHKKDEIP